TSVATSGKRWWRRIVAMASSITASRVLASMGTSAEVTRTLLRGCFPTATAPRCNNQGDVPAARLYVKRRADLDANARLSVETARGPSLRSGVCSSFAGAHPVPLRSARASRPHHRRSHLNTWYPIGTSTRRDSGDVRRRDADAAHAAPAPQPAGAA